MLKLHRSIGSRTLEKPTTKSDRCANVLRTRLPSFSLNGCKVKPQQPVVGEGTIDCTKNAEKLEHNLFCTQLEEDTSHKRYRRLLAHGEVVVPFGTNRYPPGTPSGVT